MRLDIKKLKTCIFERRKIFLDKIEKAHEIVQKYHQEHLLKFYDKLEEKKKEELLDQILDTDFELLEKLYKNRDK